MLSYEAGCKARTAALCLRPADNSPFGRHLTNSLLLFKCGRTSLPDLIIQRLEMQVNRVNAIRCFQLFQPFFQQYFIESAMPDCVNICTSFRQYTHEMSGIFVKNNEYPAVVKYVLSFCIQM